MSSNKPRKSSLGTTRRGPPKAHVPYRADDLNVGKRTGIPIRSVQVHSDGFEPFEQLLTQADERTPPKLKRGRKKKPVVQQEEEDEEEEEQEQEEEDQGEMSMDIDSPRTPAAAYFNNSARQPAAQSSLSRVGNSSRPVARPSDVDFDQVPSPRQSRRSSRPGPSNLTKSTHRTHSDDEQDEFGSGGGVEEEEEQEEAHVSFTALDQEDDVEQEQQPEEEEEREETPRPKKNKGKERARDPTPEEQEQTPSDAEMEDDIAQGLQNVPEDDDEEENNEPTPKKPKRDKKAPLKAKSTKRADDYQSPPGARRGTRLRYGPLDWWRQEKVVYGKSSTGVTLVPQIKEIIRIPKEEPVPLGINNKRKRGGSSKPKSKTGWKGEGHEGAQGDAQEEVFVFNPEEGWDDDTEEIGVVFDVSIGDEGERRISYTQKMLRLQRAANADWYFQKIFGDDQFMAAGQIVIPPKCRKPSKPSRDNTYMFYVIEGAVNLKVHETSRILATGGMFMVPRGNNYFIENIADRDAKLFFTQARKTDEDGSRPPPAINGRRSSTGSLGPPENGKKKNKPNGNVNGRQANGNDEDEEGGEDGQSSSAAPELPAPAATTKGKARGKTVGVERNDGGGLGPQGVAKALRRAASTRA